MSKFKKCGTGCGRTLTAKNVRRLRVLDENVPLGGSKLGDVAKDERDLISKKKMTGLEGWARVGRQHMRYICSDCFELIKAKDSISERTIDARREGLDEEGLEILEPGKIKVIHNPKHEDYTLIK